MTKTTQEWQQLLDGTTEGPWEWIDEPDDADAQYIVDYNTGRMCLSVDAIGSGSAYGPSDPLLAAAAPEAVAEVVRLREELKALRDYYIDREARSRERLESVTDEREQFQFARFAHMHRRAHEALTRILDGRTNE